MYGENILDENKQEAEEHWESHQTGVGLTSVEERRKEGSLNRKNLRLQYSFKNIFVSVSGESSSQNPC